MLEKIDRIWTIRTLVILSAALILLVNLAAPGFAGGSEWLDRDNPGGKGDYETLEDFPVTTQCLFDDQPATGALPPGYYKANPRGGCWCVNADTASGNGCKDIVARITWSGPDQNGSTPWLNGDGPSGSGDYELAAQRLKMSCKVKDTNIEVSDDQPEPGYYNKVISGGCWCKKSETTTGTCKQVHVKFSW